MVFPPCRLRRYRAPSDLASLVIKRLLGASLRDGGRNSFHSTSNVLEDLHAYETVDNAPEVRAARSNRSRSRHRCEDEDVVITETGDQCQTHV